MGGAADAEDDLEAWPSAEDERRAEEFAGSLPGRGPIVGVNPGTDRPEKIWPPDRYLEVMRRLEKERGARFLLTGGPPRRRSPPASPPSWALEPWTPPEMSAIRAPCR